MPGSLCSATASSSGDHHTALPPITGQSRWLYRPSLRAHHARQTGEKKQASADWIDSRHVFTRPDGHPIEPATLTRHFNAPGEVTLG